MHYFKFRDAKLFPACSNFRSRLDLTQQYSPHMRDWKAVEEKGVAAR